MRKNTRVKKKAKITMNVHIKMKLTACYAPSHGISKKNSIFFTDLHRLRRINSETMSNRSFTRTI